MLLGKAKEQLAWRKPSVFLKLKADVIRILTSKVHVKQAEDARCRLKKEKGWCLPS